MLDTKVVLNSSWIEAVGLPWLGRDLLEGLYMTQLGRLVLTSVRGTIHAKWSTT